MADAGREDYERQDLHLGRVSIAAGATLAGIVGALLLAWGVLVSSAHDPAGAGVTLRGEMAPEPSTPAAPPLQVHPRADLRAHLEAKQARLDSYGWVDRQQGVVHIPIERAMDVVAERGIPGWAATSTDPGAAAQEAREAALHEQERAP